MLARAGLASRREAEDWIRAGRLTINGTPATLGARVSSGDKVRLDGRLVRAAARRGGARASSSATARRGSRCARPQGEPRGRVRGCRGRVCSSGCRGAPGGASSAISPMPRVDGGLELVTSDGALAERLQRLVHALTSEFGVRVRGELTAAQLGGILSGELDSGAHLAVQRCEAAGGRGGEPLVHAAARAVPAASRCGSCSSARGRSSAACSARTSGRCALERTLGRRQFRELTQEELAALVGRRRGAPRAAERRSSGR